MPLGITQEKTMKLHFRCRRHRSWRHSWRKSQG